MTDREREKQTDQPTWRVVELRARDQKGKQGRIHGKIVADGWAGAVLRPLAIQKHQGPTNRPTDRHGKLYSRVSATKKNKRKRKIQSGQKEKKSFNLGDMEEETLQGGKSLLHKKISPSIKTRPIAQQSAHKEDGLVTV